MIFNRTNIGLYFFAF